MDSNF
jgi:hypothetical protein